MTTIRVIPCLDVHAGRVVKGTKFLNLRDQGDPVELAARYMKEGADELVFLDITASHEERSTIVELAARVARQLFIPFTVGGGIRSVEDAADILRQGADKVAVNTAAIRKPALITEIAERFGRQAVVLAMDVRREGECASPVPPIQDVPPPSPRFTVYATGGRERTELEAVEWARKAEALGAGELLVTSMDRDGTLDGYDTELLRAICGAVRVPVIASGGAGRPEHLVEAATAGADAVLVASIVHDGTYTIATLKDALADAGFPVR
jgi:cyclase